MTNKCVNISCPNYSDHRLYFSNNECSQSEIDAFDPSVLPDENEYGYEAFLKKSSSINDVILNENYDYGEVEAAVVTHHNFDAINLIYADPKEYEEKTTFAIQKSFSDITNLQVCITAYVSALAYKTIIGAMRIFNCIFKRKNIFFFSGTRYGNVWDFNLYIGNRYGRKPWWFSEGRR